MPTEKPRQTPGSMCPLVRKDVSQACHRCAWYTQIRGVNPNNGQAMDEWGCAVVFSFLMQFEIVREARHGAAATESFRNEMTRLAAIEASRHGNALPGREPPLICS